MYLIIVAIIVSVLGALLYSYYPHLKKITRKSALASKIPGPRGLPFFGSMFEFVGPKEERSGIISKLAKKYSSPCGFWIGPVFAVILSKVEEVDIVLKHPECFHKSIFYRPFAYFAENGMFVWIDTENRYKAVRRNVMRHLNPNTLNGYLNVFETHSNNFCKWIVCDKEIDIRDEAINLAVATTLEIISGFNITEEQAKYFSEMLKEGVELAFRRSFNIFLWVDTIYYMTRDGKRFKEIYETAFEQIENKVAELVSTSLNGDLDIDNPIGQLLYELRENGIILSDKILHENFLTFFVAAADTSAASVIFVLMTLGVYQDVQQKVFEEIKTHINENNEITVKGLNQLTYLESVIKETLRILPLSFLIGRRTTQDVNVGSCVIPEGTEIFIDIIGLQTDPNYWKEPLKFNPSRFSPEEYYKIPSSAYMTWGGGTRLCPGTALSVLLMKVVVLEVLKKFVIHSRYKSIHDIEINGFFLNKAKHGSLVTFKRRVDGELK